MPLQEDFDAAWRRAKNWKGWTAPQPGAPSAAPAPGINPLDEAWASVEGAAKRPSWASRAGQGLRSTGRGVSGAWGGLKRGLATTLERPFAPTRKIAAGLSKLPWVGKSVVPMAKKLPLADAIYSVGRAGLDLANQGEIASSPGMLRAESGGRAPTATERAGELLNATTLYGAAQGLKDYGAEGAKHVAELEATIGPYGKSFSSQALRNDPRVALLAMGNSPEEISRMTPEEAKAAQQQILQTAREAGVFSKGVNSPQDAVRNFRQWAEEQRKARALSDENLPEYEIETPVAAPAPRGPEGYVGPGQPAMTRGEVATQVGSGVLDLPLASRVQGLSAAQWNRVRADQAAREQTAARDADYSTMLRGLSGRVQGGPALTNEQASRYNQLTGLAAVGSGGGFYSGPNQASDSRMIRNQANSVASRRAAQGAMDRRDRLSEAAANRAVQMEGIASQERSALAKDPALREAGYRQGVAEGQAKYLEGEVQEQRQSAKEIQTMRRSLPYQKELAKYRSELAREDATLQAARQSDMGMYKLRQQMPQRLVTLQEKLRQENPSKDPAALAAMARQMMVDAYSSIFEEAEMDYLFPKRGL